MKRKSLTKRVLSMLVCVFMMCSLMSLYCVSAEETPAKLKAVTYFSPMPNKVERFAYPLQNLCDDSYEFNKFGLNVARFSPDIKSMKPEERYIDMYFNNKLASVSSLTFAGRNLPGAVNAESIKKVTVDYFDNETGKFVRYGKAIELAYINKGSYNEAVLEFSAPVTTPLIRVYLDDYGTSWGSLVVLELYATGTLGTESIIFNNGNLLYREGVNVSIAGDGKNESVIPNMYNGKLVENNETGRLFNKTFNPTPSEESPYYIEMTFPEAVVAGAMEFVTQRAGDTDIKAGRIEYESNGEWNTAVDFKFNRNQTVNALWDTVEFKGGVMSDKFRLVITSANKSWNFQMYELVLKEYEDDSAAIDNSGIYSKDINAIDGNEKTIAEKAANESIELFYKNGRADLVKLEIKGSTASADVKVEKLTNNGYKKVKTETLNFSSGSAVVFLNGVNTQKLRLTFSNDIDISEIVTYGSVSAVSKEEKIRPFGYITSLELCGGKNEYDLSRLSDGKCSNNNANFGGVVFFSEQESQFGENDYIEIINASAEHSSSVGNIKGIYFATYLGEGENLEKQSVSEVRIDYNDELNGGVWKTLIPSYKIDWNLYNWSYDGQDHTDAECVLTFDENITTSRIRVYILDAPRTWNNFRFDELYTLGETVSNTKTENGNLLYNAQEVSFSATPKPNNMLSKAYDGHAGTGVLYDYKVDTKYELTVDFGNSYYEINKLEFLDLYAANQAINKGEFYYLKDGEWINAYSFDLGRTVGRIYNNPDDGVINVDNYPKSNKFKIVFTEINHTWGNFRFNEIIFGGRNVTDEFSDSVTRGATVFSTVSGSGNFENVFDDDPETVYTMSNTGTEYAELYYRNKLVNLERIEIDSASDLRGKIAVEYFENGKWNDAPTDGGEYADEKTVFKLNNSFTSRRLRIAFTDVSAEIKNVRICGTMCYNADRKMKDENIKSEFTVSADKGGIVLSSKKYCTVDGLKINGNGFYSVFVPDDNGEYQLFAAKCLAGDEYIIPERIKGKELLIASATDGFELTEDSIEAVYGEAYDSYQGKINISSFEKGQKAVTVMVSTENRDGVRILGGTLYVAAYDVNGVLIGVTPVDNALKSSEAVTVSVADGDSVSYVSAYLFGEGIKPLAISATKY